eukprot:496582_1
MDDPEANTPEQSPLLPDEHGATQSDATKSGASSQRIVYIIVGLIVLLIPEIACVVIAPKYESSVCYENDDGYVVPLGLWLYVGGGVPLAINLLYLIFCCVYCLFMRVYDRHRVDKLYQETHGKHFCCHCSVFLFHISWAIIGLYMYANQMAPDCQSDIVGQMVLAFAIINPLQICCALCVSDRL